LSACSLILRTTIYVLDDHSTIISVIIKAYVE